MPAEKYKKIQKSNDLNQANFSDFSLSCYRVILNLIAKIKRHDANGNSIPINLVSRTCSLSVAEYAKEFGIEPDNAYAILKEATDKLMKTSFSTQMGINILKINVCSQSYYRKTEGKIDIRFTEEIMPHLAELTSNFTMYNLNDIAGFNSIYTTRFYELIMQFKSTGIIEVSVNDLRFKLGCAAKYPAYKDFKKYTFAHAMNEINQQWNFNIKLVDELKTGRAVTDLVFTFRKTFTRKAFDPIRQKMRTECISKPKRKSKQDDDNTPPPVHPKQQELPNIQQEHDKQPQHKSAAEVVLKNVAKAFRALGVEQDSVIKKALEEDASTIDASLEVIKRRTTYIAEQAKIIAKSLGISKQEAYNIAKKDFEEEEAKLKPI